MNILIHSCYLIILGLIRLFKWIEFGVLILASPIIRRIIKRKTQEMDISLFERYVPPENSVEQVTLISSSDIPGRPYLNKHINAVIHDNRLFARVANRGTIAVGEAFMNKSIELENENWEDLTEAACRLAGDRGVAEYYNFFLNKWTYWLEYEAFNKQSRVRALRAGKLHYDLGNNLFETLLDPWMQYSCAYWKTARNLNDAQVAKLEMVCQKLDLKPGMTVLDIGCGWGTLSKYMAEKYQVKVVGITIGKDGAAYGEKVCKGLPVEIKLQDYRDVKGKFDRVVSVAAFEHFGPSNYREFFKTVYNCLEDDGIALLQTIGMSYDPNFIVRTDPWLNKYIMSDFMVPYQTEITQAIKGLFTIEDWHNFGLDYAKTFYAWREKFVLVWPSLKNHYDEKFFRMWIYYLSMGRALFLTRRTQLWQIVLSKGGLKREYRAYR